MKNLFLAMVCMFVLFTLASWGCNEETDGDGDADGDSDGDGDGDGDWVCDPEFLGDGECDCGCGAPDTDCEGGGCSEAGCSAEGCLYCYDEHGEDTGCGGGDCVVPAGVYYGALAPGDGDCSADAMDAIVEAEIAIEIPEGRACGEVGTGEFESGITAGDCEVFTFGCGGDGDADGIENGWCQIGLNRCDWACTSDLVVSWLQE